MDDDMIAAVSDNKTAGMLSGAQASLLKTALETEKENVEGVIEPINQTNTAQINGVGKHLDATA